jgi:hypothetical protein
VNVVFGSAFRNSEHSVRYYMKRIRSYINATPEHNVRVIAVEGDSTDGTRLELARSRDDVSLDLHTCNHGQRVFGSTEEPDRLKALSMVGNAILSGVTPQDDVLVYIESDLMWEASTINILVAAAASRFHGFDVFAPMIMAGRAFYDIWGFRKAGVRFGPFFPYHGLLDHSKPVDEVDSVGSCLVMRGEIARQCRILNDYCLVGLCEDIRNHGYRIGVMPSLQVRQA